MKTIRVDSAFTLKQAVANLLELKDINTENMQYADITSKQQISEFIYNVVIEQIYDESIKQYVSLNEKYHYLNYYNFFMGMRITQNRVSFKKMQYICTPDVVDNVRKFDYSGDTATRYGSLDTDPFGTDKISYWNDWGYAGAGGFVHYFDSLLNLTQAQDKFNKMYDDGLISEALLDTLL